MKAITILIICITCLSCAGSLGLNEQANLKVHAGVNYGGIIENTDLSAVDNVPVDAYSGATSLGFSMGARYSYPLKKHGIQTGLDLLGNKNAFTYSDDINGYDGSRDLFTTQLRIPLLFSLHLIKDDLGSPLIKLNMGLSGGLVFCSETRAEGNIPSYEVNNFSLGPALGFEIHPLELKNKASLGFSFELSRSFQETYVDFYQQGDMPGASYLRLGLIYGFSGKNK